MDRYGINEDRGKMKIDTWENEVRYGINEHRDGQMKIDMV